MKSHNPDNSGPVECTAPEWDLIPWYVNGSLPADEADSVRAHCETCPACAAEVKAQQRLAAKLQVTDLFEEEQARSWDHLKAQIEADARARAPKGRDWSFMSKGWLALAGGAVAACLVVAVQFGQPAGQEFETLTSETVDAASLIRFQTQPGLPESALEAVLKTHGATLVAGPSEAGVYVAQVNDTANTKTVAVALMSTDEIIFAAPEVVE